MKTPVILVVLGLLGGCGEKPANDSGVTAEEAQALNETEKMLDESHEPSGNDAPSNEQ